MTVCREIPYSSVCDDAISSYVVGVADSPVDTPKFRSLLGAMVGFASSFVAGVERVEIFSAGMRSVVVGVWGATGGVVVKHFRRKDSASNSGGFGYLREKHGLVALESLGSGCFSALRGFDDSARFLALEEVTGAPLSEVFLSSQDGAPTLALRVWVDFWLARLSCAQQEQAQKDFVAALAEADPAAITPGSLTSPKLAVKGLERLCALESVEVSSAEFQKRQKLVEGILIPDQADLVLSSGDFSPANLLVETDSSPRVRGIDAEGSAVHHWALPLAEVLLGFPSHPVFRLPEELVQSPEYQAEATRFYTRLCPGSPAEAPLADERVHGAVLTLRSLLLEQTGELVADPFSAG